MKNVQVRDVPDATHDVLRRRAREGGQSLQAYLLGELNGLAAQPTVAELMRRIDGRGDVGSTLTTIAVVEGIREDRDGH